MQYFIIYIQLRSMNDNFSQLKQQNFIIQSETGQPQHQKLIYSHDYSSLNEIKVGKFEQNLEKFQINTLVFENITQNIQRTTPDFENLTITIQKDKILQEKSKVETKQKKRKKAFTLQQVFNSYLYFVEKEYQQPELGSFLNYYFRRNQIFNETQQIKTDLGVYSVREIVEFALDKKIISQQVYVEYSFEKEFIQEENFIKKLHNKKSELLQIGKMYFTPFDHRLLCKILCQQFPNQFKFPSKLLLQSNKLTKFYSYLYWLPEEQYQELCRNLNNRFNRTWMPECFTSFSNIISEKLKNTPNSKQETSYPFHMPPRKLRKKY